LAHFQTNLMLTFYIMWYRK